ncbi:DNA-directed RNA polymerase II subunit 1-like [Cyclospora cayetanensis]|uniref:DNA-directed RNA polymerase II subunit 1-like n=1 Tax=Cyclospora cayetanensis TaxID=88456 RepID=A0A6P6S437_9EIME|nr:DNA-directed RNA polymerase II subunit 1-like [Cyclospora cayetanensis]
MTPPLRGSPTGRLSAAAAAIATAAMSALLLSPSAKAQEPYGVPSPQVASELSGLGYFTASLDTRAISAGQYSASPETFSVSPSSSIPAFDSFTPYAPPAAPSFAPSAAPPFAPSAAPPFAPSAAPPFAPSAAPPFAPSDAGIATTEATATAASAYEAYASGGLTASSGSPYTPASNPVSPSYFDVGSPSYSPAAYQSTAQYDTTPTSEPSPTTPTSYSSPTAAAAPSEVLQQAQMMPPTQQSDVGSVTITPIQTAAATLG